MNALFTKRRRRRCGSSSSSEILFDSRVSDSSSLEQRTLVERWRVGYRKGALRWLWTLAATAVLTTAGYTVPVRAADLDVPDGEYRLFHHHDTLGSTVATTDQEGRVLWYEHARPYGASTGRRSVEGRELDRPDALGDDFEARTWLDTDRSPLGYAGHPRDRGSGLVYMQARHYDPVLGRFLSNDPVGFTTLSPMSFNRYAYANNSPFAYADPDGQFAFLIAAGPYVPAAVAAAKTFLIGVGVIGSAALIQENLVQPQVDRMLNENVSDAANENGDQGESPPSGWRRGKNRLPNKGPPNTIVENGPGTQRKRYGPNGNVVQEWNAGHDDMNTPDVEKEPHIHDWTDPNPRNPNGVGERQQGRAPTPEDLENMGFD